MIATSGKGERCYRDNRDSAAIFASDTGLEYYPQDYLAENSHFRAPVGPTGRLLPTGGSVRTPRSLAHVSVFQGCGGGRGVGASAEQQTSKARASSAEAYVYDYRASPIKSLVHTYIEPTG
jgi:hypothetical protein